MGHPLLRHLPTRAQGAVFHREIAKSLPPEPSNLPFTLKLTDDKVNSATYTCTLVLILKITLHAGSVLFSL